MRVRWTGPHRRGILARVLNKYAMPLLATDQSPNTRRMAGHSVRAPTRLSGRDAADTRSISGLERAPSDTRAGAARPVQRGGGRWGVSEVVARLEGNRRKGQVGGERGGEPS